MDVAVIIGVGGMGEAIARRIGSGIKLVLADFNEETLNNLSEALTGDGFDVTAQGVDVGERESVEELAKVASELGPIKYVVHTAGLSPQQAPTEAIIKVDALGVAYVLDVFGEVVAEGGSGIVIASMAGSFAAGQLPAEAEGAMRVTPADQLTALPMLDPGKLPNAGAAYSMAKRMNQLRVEAASTSWGARGARINCISPGVISTPMGREELAGESGAGMRMMIEGSGTKRAGTPSDIAEAAAFLLSPQASFITGVNLLVDGGVVAGVYSGAISLPRG